MLYVFLDETYSKVELYQILNTSYFKIKGFPWLLYFDLNLYLIFIFNLSNQIQSKSGDQWRVNVGAFFLQKQKWLNVFLFADFIFCS